MKSSSRACAAGVALYAGLLAGASRPKIVMHRGETPPYGALWASRITGPAGSSIR